MSGLPNKDELPKGGLQQQRQDPRVVDQQEVSGTDAEKTSSKQDGEASAL